MRNKSYQLIKKYADILSRMEGFDQRRAKIMLNVDGRIYETEKHCDFANLQPEDVISVSGTADSLYPVEYKLLKSRNSINAIVLSATPYCIRCSQWGEDLPAAIDDMAQIVGHKVRCVPYDEKSIIAALRHKTACFVKDHYTITLGRTLYEAVVALHVLEKSAEIHAKAAVLGGTKKIPVLEAKAMRRHYVKKYSRAEQQAKGKEER